MIDCAFVNDGEQVASDTLRSAFFAQIIHIEKRNRDEVVKSFRMVISLETFLNHSLEPTHGHRDLSLVVLLPMTACDLPSGSGLAESGSPVQQK